MQTLRQKWWGPVTKTGYVMKAKLWAALIGMPTFDENSRSETIEES